jgi:hypothetical protein
MHTYIAYGLKLESEIELPELAAYHTALVCDAESISIQIADVPEDLSDAVTTVEGYRVQQDKALFVMNGTARYLITGGNTITVFPVEGHDPAWLRIVLISGALGILLHQRGLFPLHASAVVFEGNCIAFGGNSGAGKSTLAAGLSRQGLKLLAEDKLVVRKTEQGWMAWPGIPFLHLFPDSAIRGDLSAQTRASTSPRTGKYIHLDSQRFEREPKPLKALYMVDWASTESGAHIAPMSAMEAFLDLRVHASLNGLIPAMGREAAFLSWATGLLKDIDVYRFTRPQDYISFEDGLDQLRAHWISLG